MLVEMNGVYWGASVDGGGGPIVCDDLGNNRHYHLAEVDASGRITKDREGRWNQLPLENLREKGIRVLRGVNDNPVVGPGDELMVAVGGQKVSIVGSNNVEILFNGDTPTKIKGQLERVRYSF